MIPHSSPTLGREELSAVARVLSSGHISQGKNVTDFERQFAQFFSLRNAATVNSGTSALHLALIAVGVKTGDEVIIPSFVCTALLNAINYIGANAVIADINGEDYNLSYDDAKRRVTKKTKAVIIPHIFGTPARDTEKFKDMGVPVIEDCAQSIGSKIGGQYVGTIGDVSVFSFYATKVMTTGEGGMVASNSSELVGRICDLRDYDNKDDYMVRYNYKMTDIQAAMGIEQLKKLPDFINRRIIIAERYNEGLKDLPVRLPMASSESDSIWFRYVIYSERADGLIKYLHEKGIAAAKPVFKPLHILLGNKGDCPVSDKVWNNTVSLPIYPLLSDADVEMIIECIRLYFSHLPE